MIETEPKVSYLGPPGTYSEMAAEKMYGQASKLIPRDTLPEVIQEVQEGPAEVAILPVVNSTEGAVIETHRLLLNTDLKIIGETSMKIEHCLLGLPEIMASKSAARVVYGHQQALGQCLGWLQTSIPNAELRPVSSSSMAAIKAAEDSAALAVAPENTANKYDLQVIDVGINDEDDNQTRFISVGRQEPQPSGNDKTSIVFRSKNNDAGALVKILSSLAYRGISMTAVHSQPIDLTNYRFYVDFEGHQADQNVTDALLEMRSEARDFKILGSYPVAELVQ
jgi:chorismate mutase / prephenate dehydratase